METTIVPSNGTTGETHATPDVVVGKLQATYDYEYDGEERALRKDPDADFRFIRAGARADARAARKRAVLSLVTRRK